MTILGHVHKNKIILDDEKTELPEGCIVKIIPLLTSKEKDDICGSWEDERSADEIIEDIRNSRNNKTREISL